jgi:hypothetical protein
MRRAYGGIYDRVCHILRKILEKDESGPVALRGFVAAGAWAAVGAGDR